MLCTRARRDRCRNSRAGGILLLGVALIVVLLGLAALAIDVGYLYVARLQLRTAADAAAMAAAGEYGFSHDEQSAIQAALAIASENTAAGKPVTLDPDKDIIFGRYTLNEATGSWEFEPWAKPYDSVQVIARRSKDSDPTGPGTGPVGLLFGPVLGFTEVSVGARATAKFQPRDIALVIDLSGSMTYDSSLLHANRTQINIKQIWEALGKPTYGNMKDFDTLVTYSPFLSNSTILKKLGLTNVPYPFPGGSWNEYVSFVKYASHLKTQGYANRYGLKTFVDYLLLYRRSYKSTPVLWSTPQQPLTAIKEATEIMIEYLKTLDTPEMVALATFDTYSRIEIPMTSNLDAVPATLWKRQAGHYYNYTNIGDGIKSGHEALTKAPARDSAFKVMVVLTDGRANRPFSLAAARQHALKAAKAAAADGIVIHTITFGSEADQSLMKQIAKIGAGLHYHVPNTSVAQYSETLKKVFLDIASNRPVVLVQ